MSVLIYSPLFEPQNRRMDCGSYCTYCEFSVSCSGGSYGAESQFHEFVVMLLLFLIVEGGGAVIATPNAYKQ
jgi:hypothetical protein